MSVGTREGSVEIDEAAQRLASILRSYTGEICPVRAATFALMVDPDAPVELSAEVRTAVDVLVPHFSIWYKKDQLVQLSTDLDLLRDQMAICRHHPLTEDEKLLTGLVTVQRLLREECRLAELQA